MQRCMRCGRFVSAGRERFTVPDLRRASGFRTGPACAGCATELRAHMAEVQAVEALPHIADEASLDYLARENAAYSAAYRAERAR